MDNPIFPTGPYLDDLPQVCTLCGMLFNNSLNLQHHMQLHFLTATANQILATQPPDPGLGLNPAPNILELVAGTSVVPTAGAQHVVSVAPTLVVPGSSATNPLIPAQALFTVNTAASVPSHLITSSIGNVSAPLLNPLPQKTKEKKQKTKAPPPSITAGSSASSVASTRSTAPSSARNLTSLPHQSRDTTNTYISTFPTDLQKIDLTSPVKSSTQLPSSKEDVEPFLPTMSQTDSVEEALKTPAFTKVSQFDRQSSNTALSSPRESQTKDPKLFQPFVTVEEPLGLSFMSKSNTLFTADSLISPVKTGPDKSVDLDILTTPQKPYSSLHGSDSLSSSPKPLPTVPLTNDLRHFARGKPKDHPIDYNQLGEKLKEISKAKVSQSSADNVPAKPPFYPGLIDPMNISPKSTQLFRDNKSVNVSQQVIPVPTYINSGSSSPDLKTSISIASEPSSVPMVSPKVSVDLTSTSSATAIHTAASKPAVYGSGEDGPAGIPPVFGSSKPSSQASVAPVLMNPAVGLTDVSNPLGTGYFNALTQKLLNPALSMGSDFNKPNTSSFNYGSDSQGQKSKSYYENGILINQDYDKISDTNDDEDLEKLIDDIDSKDDNIDSKSYPACSEIEDLLNEFNEKHPEDLNKNKSQMDEFLNDVLNENLRLKLDDNTEDAVPSAEDMAMNQIAISELLEKEKEIIEKESKMLESARLNASVASTSQDSDEGEFTVMSSTTTTVTTTTVNSSSQVSITDSSTTPVKSNAKEDDPADFEIPKVGKLMKIRKYFQIQEQKKKEKTQIDKLAEAEVKIQIREKEPEIQKPQTILVQVSKRKKIEYGPYINRQSLLEGKPKEAEQVPSPPKVFRPKPKPQVPTRRTFNLRARKTKTDFATLASKGSKVPEVKKDKSRESNDSEENANNIGDDEIFEEEMKDADEEEEESEEMTGSVEKDEIVTRSKEKEDTVTRSKEKGDTSTRNKDKDDVGIVTRQKEKDDTGIVTRHKEKEKKSVETGQGQTGKTKSKENESKTENDKDSQRNDSKPNLRTRSNKTQNDENVTDSKNLRKRTSKSPAEGSKVKITKTDTRSSKPELGERVIGVKLRSKETREGKEDKDFKESNKEKKKLTPDKADIRMCSVNLGENLTESKIKAATNTAAQNSEKVKFKQAIVKSVEKTNKVEKTIELDTEEKLSNACVEKEDSEVKTSVEEPAAQQADVIADEGNTKESVPEPTVNILEKQIKDVTDETKLEHSDEKQDDPKDSKSTSDQLETMTVTIVNNKEEQSKETCQTEIEPVKQDPPVVREKLTMKFKLGVSSFATIMKNSSSKSKKRKTDHSPRIETYKIEETSLNIENSPKNETYTIEETSLNIDNSPKMKTYKIEETSLNIENSPKMETYKIAETSFNIENSPKASLNIENSPKANVNIENSPKASLNIENSPKASVNIENSPNARDSPDGAVVAPSVQLEKKVKHSVENEFQRLVDEAMAEVKNAKQNESGKQERYVNLRKRLNDSVKYNVDDSDDELDVKAEFVLQRGLPITNLDKTLSKAGRGGPKCMKTSLKSIGRMANKSPLSDALKPKKDMDVYDFTDTELSDKEDSAPPNLSFKPKYVSNLKLFGQNKIPFVSKPLVSETGEMEDEDKLESDNGCAESETSYIGQTVEPLKIKLSKIIPYKEKRHKHKKKKRKKDRERRHQEKQESFGSDTDLKTDEIKIFDIMSVDSDSNDGQDEDIDSAMTKVTKKPKLKEKKHICSFCNQGFGQKCDLRKHVMIHTGERPWPCEICDKKFQRKTDLVKHTRTHTGEKPYACEFCDKRVSDKSQLNVHRRLHTGDRPYQCTKCGKKCITSSELTRHRSVHCSEKSHQCELCKKTFKIKECLGMHMKMHYRSKGKLYHCDKCAVGFDKKADMDSHSCAIWSTNMYICSECYEEFTDELVYAEHIKTHDLGVFSCNMCTHIFEDKHSLETHLCSMGIEKQKHFQCDICDEIFHDQNVLSQHLLVHDNDTGSFMCDLCPEIFTVRKDLTLHVIQHREETSSQVKPVDSRRHSNRSVSSENVLKGMKNEIIDVDSFHPERGGERILGFKISKGMIERASVISNNFRQAENSMETLHRPYSKGLGSRSRLTDTVAGNGVFSRTLRGDRRSATAKTDILASEKIFEASDFANSPDFSSLTDEPDLSVNPFEKIGTPGESLSNGSKMNKKLNPGEVNERENGGMGTGLNHSIKEEETSSKLYHSITSSIQGSSESAQNSRDYSWTGSYQISANDYVNSLLSKMGSDQSMTPPSDLSVKSQAIKSENHESDSIKTSGILSPSSRGDLYKDNIENRSKSDFFSEFDFQIGQKPDTFQSSCPSKASSAQKYSNSGVRENTAFQGLDQNLYNLSRNRHFGETSPFSNTFMGPFQQNSMYNSGNSSLFGSSNSEVIHKRNAASNIFGANQDMLQSNFYLGVEESLKGTSPSDKTDETTALLSNFDYGIN